VIHGQIWFAHDPCFKNILSRMRNFSQMTSQSNGSLGLYPNSPRSNKAVQHLTAKYFATPHCSGTADKTCG